jgi:hypothetical protein
VESRSGTTKVGNDGWGPPVSGCGGGCVTRAAVGQKLNQAAACCANGDQAKEIRGRRQTSLTGCAAKLGQQG